MMRALIVDDERMARKRIRTLLARESDVEVVGECGNGLAAVDAITKERPDVVFLDVQMPELDGFEVLRRLEAERIPLVVFVTAFDEHALQAFEVNALDYLTKPFDRERFKATLQRVRSQLALSRSAGAASLDEFERRVSTLLQQVARRPRFDERLVLKDAGRISFLRVDDVDWIESAGNYVKVHAGKATHLLHETLTGLAARLDPEKFARVHRSTVVNLQRLRTIEPWFHGDAIGTLADGTKVSISRTYRAALERVLR